MSPCRSLVRAMSQDDCMRLSVAMRAAKVGKAELWRRLDWHLPQVDRLLTMTHGSKLEQLEAAFGVLGRRIRLRWRTFGPDD